MKKNVFIDGEIGTTGLQVHEKLTKHPNVNILSVNQDKRKDLNYKREMFKASDVSFLCLPDDGAIDGNDGVRPMRVHTNMCIHMAWQTVKAVVCTP